MDDLDKVQGGTVDPEFEAMYGGGLGEEESERRVGFEPVAIFDFYVVKALKAKGFLMGERDTPKCSPTVEILEGPDGTVGRHVYDSRGIFFKPGENKKASRKDKEAGRSVDENGRTPRTPEEMVSARENMRGSLLRIQRRLRLESGFPTGFGLTNIEAYAEQFGNTAPFIVKIGTETGSDNQVRNTLDWFSIAGFDDEVVDGNGKPTGKSAIEQAREEIAKRNKRLATAGGKKRTKGTASQYVPAGTQPVGNALS